MRDYAIFRARLGSAIRRRRKALGITQTQLAERANKEQSTIARVERGRQGMDNETLFQIGQALGCSLTDLMSEAERSLTSGIPDAAISLAQSWLALPADMREDYRIRIEALAQAMRRPVPDERPEAPHHPRRQAAKH